MSLDKSLEIRNLLLNNDQNSLLKLGYTSEVLSAGNTCNDLVRVCTEESSDRSQYILDVKSSVKSAGTSFNIAGTLCIGKNFKGSLRITVSCQNFFVYIGDNCTFSSLEIAMHSDGDSVVILGHTTFGHGCRIICPPNEPEVSLDDLWIPTVLIREDCMIASGVKIRAGDSHPYISLNTLQTLNNRKKHVEIGPHVWIGEDSVVLKNVTVAGCSVVGTSSVVTKSCPPFSVVTGAPATFKHNDTCTWTRTTDDWAIKAAIKWANYCRREKLTT